ncbi:hypothetical protein [Mucilaginibacter sp. PAMB04168]|uniref:hypothetical protein n=1 Tax=Mucilaginibacter sp. PAMB04168 TaxID=3138567 RepID=UPI0031F66597
MYKSDLWPALGSGLLHYWLMIKSYLSTYKYFFIVIITSMLAGAYLYQSNRISHYEASASVRFEPARDAATQQQLFKEVYNELTADYNLTAVKPAGRPNTLTVTATGESAYKAEAAITALTDSYRYKALNHVGKQVNTRRFNDSVAALKDELSTLNEKIRLGALQAAANPAERAVLKEKFVKQSRILDVVVNYVSKPISSFVVIPDSFIPPDDDLLKSINKFNELQLQKQSYLGAKSLNDPNTVRFNQQINFLQEQIKRQVVVQRAYLQKQLNPGTDTAASLQQYRLQSAHISAAIDSLTALKQSAIGRPAPASSAIAVTSFKSRAMHAQSPLFYIAAVLAGILFSVLAVYILQMLNRKIHSVADIKRTTKIPVVTELEPQQNEGEPGADISVNALASYIFNVHSHHQTIWVTANTDEEGARQLALQLAQALAHTGKSTVLVDNDMPDSLSYDELGLPYNKGLYEYLNADIVTIDDLIVPVQGADSLYFIGSGVAKNQHKAEMVSMLGLLDISPNLSAEADPIQKAMPDRKFNQLINQLHKQFDYIVVSGPLLEDYAHPMISRTDITFYLVTYKITDKAQLVRLNELWQAGQINSPAIVAKHAAH